jgi:putative DNA primase/helicase
MFDNGQRTEFDALTERDFAMFGKSFITKKITARAGIFRVDSETGQQLSGQARPGNYSGIIFPYRYPDQKEVREYRLRRDRPDLEQGNDGLKEVRKYLSPPGKGNMIYFSPGCQSDWLSDGSLPIVLTEGEKKTLALDRVAWDGLGDSAEKPRFVALGLSGVWNFRGIIAKTTDANGHRRDVKGLIPDFHLLSLAGRKVTILFDSNVRTNEQVRAARARLAKEMQTLGAKVFLADCPEVESCNGIDDVLGSWEQNAGEEKAVVQCLELLDQAKECSAERVSQADKLLIIAEGLELFHTPQNEAFAAIKVDEHAEYHRLNSGSFRHYLGYQFYKKEGKAPTAQSLQDTINALTGEAVFDGQSYDIHIRIASFEGNIYLDLCNERWQVIEISKAGWRIIEAADAPVRFKRNNAMGPLPTPYRSGADIDRLRKFLNVDDENLILILSWLINTFRPDYPFPVLILSGEQGTAKSTTSRLLRELIDPSDIPLRSSPRNEQDLIIAAVRSWVIGLDNLSHIQDWFSDALCRLSTGGGFGARKLYTDDEENVLNAMRPIVINGIGDLASRSDLLDRALIVKLEPIPPNKRKSESQFWVEFDKEKSHIFTGLLDAVVCGLQRFGEIAITDLPRMADFAQWVTACEPALGLRSNSFLNVYNLNRQNVHSIVLEGSILAAVIQEFCNRNVVGDHYEHEFLLKDFLAAITTVAGDKRSTNKLFPRNPKGLRNGIERINPNLREIGIFIHFLGKKGSSARYGASLSIEYICKQPSPTSTNSEAKSATPDILNTYKPDVPGDESGDFTFQASNNITETSPGVTLDLSKLCDGDDGGDVTQQTFSSAAK